MSPDTVKFHRNRWIFNASLALIASAVTLTGVLVLHDWSGAWSYLLMGFVVLYDGEEGSADD